MGVGPLAPKTYTELSRLLTFEERFDYASLNGNVADVTFGGRRFINQSFYRSVEWKRVRDFVIVRDGGCDLGILERPIFGKVLVHHLNPISIDDVNRLDLLLDPEFLICVSHATHNALHYSNAESLPKDYKPRSPDDTCPWKIQNVLTDRSEGKV